MSAANPTSPSASDATRLTPNQTTTGNPCVSSADSITSRPAQCKKKARPPPPTAQLGHKLPNQSIHRPAPHDNASQQRRHTAN
ncbi:hypothetical protein HPB48_011702 [Haemaphysalis longicornis]|uniref:Uncharacterized protein n=1 Tax=Haemaphysalis longicornis TaxID=44386 RepID=A0A9J6FAL7_HAELO|nr:hypothetical protein HPB48_011702 [Haemaphysalis longicornis]